MTARRSPDVVAFVAAAPRVDSDGRAGAQRLVESMPNNAGRLHIATCHRVEVVEAASPSEDHPLAREPFVALTGVDAARHVIALAVGLDSAVLAEDQLLHQLRTAVTTARAHGPLGRDVDSLVDVALRAGRVARSWRPAKDGVDRSLADTVIRHLQTTVDGIAGRRVLVVGTGAMGRDVAVAARRAGALVAIASRTEARAGIEAARLRVDAWPIDPGSRLAMTDAVVIALAGPWRLGRASAEHLMARPVVVDLSMPSAVHEGLRDRLGERLVDIDRIAQVAVDPVHAGYRARLEDLAGATLRGYLERIVEHDRTGVERLVARMERQRAAELEAYLRRRPDAGPEVRGHLDALTRALTRRMFQEPLRRLSEDPDGRRHRAYDELFGA